MIADVRAEPMTEEFLLWRCLHGGPLSSATIDRKPARCAWPWDPCRKRNLPLLAKLTRTYGACAILSRGIPLARARDRILMRLSLRSS